MTDREPLLEVRCVETGDTAEADSPEAIIVAGRALRHDGRDAGYHLPRFLTLVFTVDGEHVRTSTRYI